MQDYLKKMEDDLKKMEDDPLKKEDDLNFFEDDLKNNNEWKTTSSTQKKSKSTLIGCDIIVN